MNVRAIYGCIQAGAGHEHLKKLCCYLNMTEPMLSNNYQNISHKLREYAKCTKEKSMSMVASKLRGADVTADGIWQRKSFTSLNGVITAISIDSGKVLDTEILSKIWKDFEKAVPECRR